MSLAKSAVDVFEEFTAKDEAPVEDLVPRTVDLAIAYTAPDGEHHEEVFPCTVVGPAARLNAERYAAAMAAPTPWDALPTSTQNRLIAFAGVVWALGLNAGLLKRKPSWLVGALEEDDDLLALVDAEVRALRARYFRGNGAAGPGEPGARALRVVALGGRGRLGEPPL